MFFTVLGRFHGTMEASDLAWVCAAENILYMNNRDPSTACAYWTMSMTYKYGDFISKANMEDYLDKALDDRDETKVRLIEETFTQIENLTLIFGADFMFHLMDWDDDGLLDEAGLNYLY